jgi:hypothetical protein
LKIDGPAMTPDYHNCGLELDDSQVTLPPGTSWHFRQYVKLHNAAGGLASGQYRLQLAVDGIAEIPVTIS